MNCRPLEDLLTQVAAILARAYPGEALATLNVVVATNEEDAATLAELRKQGFVVLTDAIRATAAMTTTASVPATAGEADALLLHPVEEFAVEAQFMRAARGLISFGISLVNDVVEHGRMRLGRPYCLHTDMERQDNFYQIALEVAAATGAGR